MSESRQEEIIAVLWIIAALLAFSNSWLVWGAIFGFKGFSDTLFAIYFAGREIRAEKKIEPVGASSE